MSTNFAFINLSLNFGEITKLFEPKLLVRYMQLISRKISCSALTELTLYEIIKDFLKFCPVAY